MLARVLVTGGAGYIGACVVEELLQRGHEPVVFDTFFFKDRDRPLFDDRVEVIRGDIRHSGDVARALSGVDSVIHLAGIVGAPACNVNPIATYTTNVESTRTLVDCMTDPELKLVPQLVFCSSCSIYGNVNGMFDQVDEDTPLMPLSSYADSKVRGERIIMDKAREVPHFSPTIMRLTTIFGWAPRPRLDLVTNNFVLRALRDKKITIYGDGQQYRSLIHVRDVARGLCAALDSPAYLRDRQVFHIGEESNNVTVADLAYTIQRHVPETEIVFLDQQETDRRDYRISCQRIKNTLNWKAKLGVEDGIAELVEKLREAEFDFADPRFYNVEYAYE